MERTTQEYQASLKCPESPLYPLSLPPRRPGPGQRVETSASKQQVGTTSRAALKTLLAARKGIGEAPENSSMSVFPVGPARSRIRPLIGLAWAGSKLAARYLGRREQRAVESQGQPKKARPPGLALASSGRRCTLVSTGGRETQLKSPARGCSCVASARLLLPAEVRGQIACAVCSCKCFKWFVSSCPPQSAARKGGS